MGRRDEGAAVACLLVALGAVLSRSADWQRPRWGHEGQLLSRLLPSPPARAFPSWQRGPLAGTGEPAFYLFLLILQIILDFAVSVKSANDIGPKAQGLLRLASSVRGPWDV